MIFHAIGLIGRIVGCSVTSTPERLNEVADRSTDRRIQIFLGWSLLNTPHGGAACQGVMRGLSCLS